ncbi:MAG TPA: mechanosensitive ion channel family protein [Bryobacteraceae bacterium]|jgi:MscS family membrane protein|nr:mechanosensitive ion channel family protein [Bryobacteraceae bacterium]
MRWKAPAALAVVLSVPAWGQILSLTPNPANSGANAAGADDAPYGRVSPRATVINFLDASQSRNWGRALRYLEIPPKLSTADLERLPRRLKYVLDNQVINLNKLSSDPAGSLDDGLPPDTERIVTVKMETGTADILLHRAKNGNGDVWLFSEATMQMVPKMAAEVDRPAIEKYLPKLLTRRTPVFSLRFWQLLALLIAVPVALALSSLFTRLLILILRPLILAITKERAGERLKAIQMPIRLIVLVLVLHTVAYSILSLPVLARQLLINLATISTVVLLAWLITRLIEISAQLTSTRLLRSRQAGSMAVMQLFRRLLKACVVGIAALVVMERLGVNLTAVLAGVSVVGIAIALAAQKTLENLFGGIMIITDQPIRVGDYCKFGTQGGTVEDIGLRSTRFRTPERTVVSVPNGQLAAMNLENFAERDKMLFNPVIGLRYESTADQVRYVLAEIRRLLYAHPKVETASARVRFTKFADSSINLEVFSYVTTRDYNEFLAIQEDLLLRVMDIVETAGSGFAFPSQTLYFGKDTGLDPAKTQAALKTVEDWREKKALPFPDYHPSEIAEFENKLPYPPPESAQADA